LDHDLGEEVEEGYALVLWIAEHGIWPTQAVSVHSSNPLGAHRMAAVIERYSLYQRVQGTKRFVA
jgi:hypothetical protein